MLERSRSRTGLSVGLQQNSANQSEPQSVQMWIDGPPNLCSADCAKQGGTSDMYAQCRRQPRACSPPGRAGSRLASTLGVSAGRSTLLRLVRELPDPSMNTVEVLGIDDFVLRADIGTAPSWSI